MKHAIGARGNDIFFGERLDTIGDWLKETKGPGTIGTETILYTAEALTLKNCGEREEGREDADGLLQR